MQARHGRQTAAVSPSIFEAMPIAPYRLAGWSPPRRYRILDRTTREMRVYNRGMDGLQEHCGE